jgi:hypothetical protein
MIVYCYQVKRRHLTNIEQSCLLGGDEVISAYSPRHLKDCYCADFQFPNGDIFPLQPRAVYLDTVEADEL